MFICMFLCACVLDLSITALGWDNFYSLLSFRLSWKKSLQFFLVIRIEVIKIWDLVTVSLLFLLSQLSVIPNDLLDLLSLLMDRLFVFSCGLLEVRDVLLNVGFVLLSAQSFAHAIGNWTLIEGLVRLNCHLDLVTYTHQQETTLGTVDGNLTDQLIKALGKKFLTEWADTGLASTALLDIGIELILQIDNVDLGCGLWWDVHHIQTTGLGVLTWRQDRVQIVLVTLLLVLTRLLHLVHGCLLLSLGLLVIDRGGDQDGCVILDEWLLRHFPFCLFQITTQKTLIIRITPLSLF